MATLQERFDNFSKLPALEMGLTGLIRTGDTFVDVRPWTVQFEAAANAFDWFQSKQSNSAINFLIVEALHVLANVGTGIWGVLQSTAPKKRCSDDAAEPYPGTVTRPVSPRTMKVLQRLLLVAGFVEVSATASETTFLASGPEAIKRLFGFSSTCTGVNVLRRAYFFELGEIEAANRRAGRVEKIATQLLDLGGVPDAQVYTEGATELGADALDGGEMKPAWMLRELLIEKRISSVPVDPRVKAWAYDGVSRSPIRDHSERNIQSAGVARSRARLQIESLPQWHCHCQL